MSCKFLLVVMNWGRSFEGSRDVIRGVMLSLNINTAGVHDTTSHVQRPTVRTVLREYSRFYAKQLFIIVRPRILSRPTRVQNYHVWWDPAMLNLNVPENFGLKHIDVLKAEGASEQSLRDYEEWRDTRSQVIAAASIPSIEVIRITELADEPPES
jgi:hypothetical protein